MQTYTAIEVNDEAIPLTHVLRQAKLSGALQFLNEAVDAALIRQAAAQFGLSVSDEELQQAANQFRIARELYDAKATEAWLAARQLSYADWESLLEQEVLTRAVRTHVTANQIQPYFAQHRLAFDVAVISRIVVRDEDTARELRAQIIEENSDFFLLARQHSIDAATRRACGYVGEVKRDELDAATEAAVFGARPGQIVGPFKTDLGWQLLRVSEIRPATLNDLTRAQIEATLFTDWLSEQRRKARIALPLLEIAKEETA